MAKNYRVILILSLVFLFFNNILLSQEFTQKELDLQDKAFKLFLDEKYEEATPIFSQLLSLYPKDANFNYGYGVCLVETNKQIDNAIKYLLSASGKSENPIILYYLGKAYHLTYKFDEALKYYNKFKEKASGSDIEKLNVDHQIDMANNGKDLIKYISDLIVIDNKKIKSENFFYSYELKDFGGKLILKPNEIRTKIDKKNEDRPIMFLPVDSSDIYYASYGNIKTNSKDIYKIKKLKDGKWTVPENLGSVINTSFDEDFPYYNTVSNTLYFSSKGHNSMGGYDIFKSIYDTTSKTWSKPANMDFPTNTPYDDILFVTDSIETYAYFASNRETFNDQISVYKIQVDKNPILKEFTNLEEVIQKSKLEVSPIAINNLKNNDNNKNTNKNLIVNTNKSNNTNNPNINNINNSNIIVPYNIKNDDFSQINNLTKKDIYNNAKRDADSLNDNTKKLKKESDIIYIIANNKNNQAKNKYDESSNIYKSLSNIKNEKLRKEKNNTADSLINVADNLTNEASYSYNLADKLINSVENNKTETDNAYKFANQLLNDTNSNVGQLVDKLNDNRKNIKSNKNKIITIDDEISYQNEITQKNENEIKQSKEKINKLNNEITDIDNEINKQYSNLIFQKDSASKNKINKKINTLKTDADNKISERRNLTAKNNKLIADNNKIKNEINLLQNVKKENYFSKKDSDIAVLSNKIDKVKLNKEISNKLLIVQANVAKNEKNNVDNNIIADNVNNIKTKIDTTNKLVVDNNKTKTDTTNKLVVDNNKTKTDTTNKLVVDNNKTKTDTTNKLLVDNNKTKTDTTNKLVVDNNKTKTDTTNKLVVDNNKTKTDTTNKLVVDNNKTKTDTTNKLVVDNNKTKTDTTNNLIAENIVNSDTTGKNVNNKLVTNNNKQKTINNITIEDEIQILYDQAKKDEQISDSLSNMINDKKNSLKNITNKQQKEIVQNEINELEQLKTIKKNQSDKNYDFAYQKQQTLTDWNNKKVNEIKAVNSIYPFASDSTVDSKQKQYQKGIFISNYYSNLIKEQNKKLNILQNSLNNTTDNITQEQLKLEIGKLNKLIENNNKILLTNNNNIRNLEKNSDYNKSHQENDEILVDATNYNPEFIVEFNKSQKDSLAVSDQNKILAIQQLGEWSKTDNEIEKIDSLINNTENTKEENKLKKEKQKLSDKSYQQYLAYNSSIDIANRKEYYVYGSLLEENKLKTNSENITLANQLEKESELYYAKSENIRQNIDLYDNNEDKIAELNKANNLQKIAIQKRKYVLDLYIKTKDQLLSNDTIKLANLKNNQNTLYKNEITLSHSELEQLNNYQRDISKADMIKNNAIKNLNYVKEKQQLAKTLFSKESQDEVLMGIDKMENDNKTNLVNAYNIYSIADSTKYILNKNIINQIIAGNTDSINNKNIINQYINDATNNYNESLKSRGKIKLLTNNDDKIKELQIANSFENKALTLQEMTLDLLTNQKVDLLSSNNEFIKLDILNIINQPINTDDVVKIKTQRLFENMKLAEKDIDKLNLLAIKQIESDSLSKINFEIIKQINILKSQNDTLQNEKQKKENDKKIDENQVQLDKNIAVLNENYKFINSSLFNFYNNNLDAYRVNDNSSNIRKGKQLENDALNYFNEAQNLRNKANDEKNIDIKNKYLSNANNLELQAISSNEKAIGLYLKLNPTTEEIQLYAEENNNKLNKIIADSLNNKLIADNSNNSKNNLITNENNNTQKDTTKNEIVVNNVENNKIVTDTAKNIVIVKDTAQNNLIVNNNVKSDTNKVNNILKDTTQNKLIANNIENNNVKSDTNKVVNIPKDTTQNKLVVENNQEKNINQKDTTQNKLVVNNVTNEVNKNIKIDTTQINKPDLTVNNLNTTEDFGYSVLPISVYSEENPIPFNVKLPDGIVFKVQIGAFNTFVNSDNFKGLNPITSEKLPNSQYIKYLVGLFRTLEASKLVLQEVKTMGYKDAFIVAYNNGKRIAIFEAMNILKGTQGKVSEAYNFVVQNEVNKIKNRTYNPTINNANNKNINIVKSQNLKDIKGLLYTIQIGVFKKQVSNDQLMNINPIYTEQTPYGFIRYTTGIFSDFSKATTEKDKIVRLGITDAFVACYYNGKRISNDDAKNIIKTNKNVEFAPNVNFSLPEQNINEVNKNINKNVNLENDTNVNPVNVVFKVQIGVFKEQVPTDVVNTFIKVSANRGLDVIKTNDGTTIYAVGKFKNYDEAIQMRGMLKNDGIKDAFIVAYDGNKKISVENAKNLLKK